MNKGWLTPDRVYVHEFFRMRAAADILPLGVFPNVKEITESMAAFTASARLVDRSRSDVLCVAVGDGVTPRTATLCAFLSKWQCWSIDPNLREGKIAGWEAKVQRLRCIKGRAEEQSIKTTSPVVVLAVHSHAPLHEFLPRIDAKEVYVVAVPCCVPQRVEVDLRKLDRGLWEIDPSYQYEDGGIWSEKKLVKVWENLKATPLERIRRLK